MNLPYLGALPIFNRPSSSSNPPRHWRQEQDHLLGPVAEHQEHHRGGDRQREVQRAVQRGRDDGNPRGFTKGTRRKLGVGPGGIPSGYVKIAIENGHL